MTFAIHEMFHTTVGTVAHTAVLRVDRFFAYFDEQSGFRLLKRQRQSFANVLCDSLCWCFGCVCVRACTLV